MRKTSQFKTWIRLVVLISPIIFLAISAGSTTNEARVQSGAIEKVKVITSNGIESFVKDLNDNGKLGYRLENSLSYGGEGRTQEQAMPIRSR